MDLNERSTDKIVVIGFDIEWKVDFKTQAYHDTATVQVCESESKCYGFHVSVMKSFPSELKRILSNERILKVGVGINGDMNRLECETGVKPNGIVDLSKLADKKLGTTENWSLAGLATNQLGYRLRKNYDVRCGDWEEYPLSDAQLEYAALDAYASLLVYQKLVSL